LHLVGYFHSYITMHGFMNVKRQLGRTGVDGRIIIRLILK